MSDFFESLLRDVNEYDEQQDSRNNVTELNPEKTRTLPQVKSPENVAKPVAEKQTDTRIFETLPPVAPVIEETVKIPTPAIEPALKQEARVIAPPVTPSKESLAEPDSQIQSTDGGSHNPVVPESRPDWTQREFQAMLFKVAGLTLAVPLVDLAGVVVCDLENVTEMPGHADFYLGLMNHLGKSVPLVDTARFVLPPDKLDRLTGSDPSDRITHAVMINNAQYALACDEVDEVINLKPEAVRWRTQRTQRRWLAGTVIEHMCALIDAPAFAELLATRAPIQAFRD